MQTLSSIALCFGIMESVISESNNYMNRTQDFYLRQSSGQIFSSGGRRKPTTGEDSQPETISVSLNLVLTSLLQQTTMRWPNEDLPWSIQRQHEGEAGSNMKQKMALLIEEKGEGVVESLQGVFCFRMRTTRVWQQRHMLNVGSFEWIWAGVKRDSQEQSSTH